MDGVGCFVCRNDNGQDWCRPVGPNRGMHCGYADNLLSHSVAPCLAFAQVYFEGDFPNPAPVFGDLVLVHGSVLYNHTQPRCEPGTTVADTTLNFVIQAETFTVLRHTGTTERFESVMLYHTTGFVQRVVDDRVEVISSAWDPEVRFC